MTGLRTRLSSAAFVALVLTGVALVGIALGGCISAEDDGGGFEPMCENSSDCDQASGEVCDEGVCWGDPPEDARFAAVIFPPLERPDLSFAIVDSLAISEDGTVAGLDFPEAVTIRGRVLLACPEGDGEVLYTCGDGASVGAQITVERAAPFAGGPSLVSNVAALPDVGPGQDAFAIRLPRDPDTEIRLTITPDDTAGGEDISPGEIAPPRQITLFADSDQAVDWTIGDPAELKVIRGVVENAVGEPYAGMQVTALGRWTELSPLTRASSRSFTGADGSFTLSVPIGMLDEFDIVVTPAPGITLPTLRLINEFVRDPAKGESEFHDIEPLVMPAAPNPTTFKLPVEATATAGGQERVPGAAVRFTTRLPLPKTELRDIEVTFAAQAVTSGVDAPAPGVAEVELYPGGDANRIYQVSVVPPPDSPFHSAFDLEIAVGLGGAQVLQAVALARRVAVTGAAVSHAGDALADAPIKATPSSQLEIEADEASVGGILDQLQFPTDTTDETGSFLMWLDRDVAGATASYDVEVSPPFLSGAPTWTFEVIEVPAQGESVDLGSLELPPASYARGIVRDPAGDAVAGAELHLYQLPESDFCVRVLGLGSENDCDPPARLRTISPSDDAGWVTMALPDP